MNTTDERVYVTCDEWCAKRIHDPEKDHDANCGAPLPYRKKLAKDLKAKKLKAAADAGSEPEPEKTTRRRGEVNGQVAVIQHNPPANPDKPDYSRFWQDPEIELPWVFALQAKFDAQDITLGGITAGKACIGKMTTRDDEGAAIEADCPHSTVLRSVRKNTCNLEHVHSETLSQVCLIHAVTAWGGDVAPADSGPLFLET